MASDNAACYDMASCAITSCDVAPYDVASSNVASCICQALDSGAVAPGDVLARAAKAHPRQGLTLVHFSAQPEPFLTQKHTLLDP